MKKVFLVTILMVINTTVLHAQEQQEVPYTLADRDRLIQVETKQDALSDRLDKFEENINNRIDRLEDKFDTYFTWGFGLVLAGLFALFGFIIYDRRTAITPVKREQDKMLEALKTLAKEDAKIKEALKKAALW